MLRGGTRGRMPRFCVLICVLIFRGWQCLRDGTHRTNSGAKTPLFNHLRRNQRLRKGTRWSAVGPLELALLTSFYSGGYRDNLLNGMKNWSGKRDTYSRPIPLSALGFSELNLCRCTKRCTICVRLPTSTDLLKSISGQCALSLYAFCKPFLRFRPKLRT
jgi:hypothetical protein